MFDPNEGKKAQSNNQPKSAQASAQQSDFFSDYLAGASDVSSRSSETIVKAVEFLNKRSEDAKRQNADRVGLQFTYIDDETAIGLPVIIAYNTRGPINGFFTIIVEEGVYDGKLRGREVQVLKEQILIDQSTSDYWDNLLVTAIARHVKQLTGKDYTHNSYMVARDCMDLTNEKYLGALYATSERNLMSLGGAPVPTIEQLNATGLTLEISHDVTPGATVEDLEGNPTYTDVTSIVSLGVPRDRNTKNRSHNARERRAILVKTQTYLDFVFQPASQVTTIPGTQETVRPAYHPVLIQADSSGVDNRTGKAFESPETALFALLAQAELAANRNYINILRRNHGGKPEIGVLGYRWEGRYNVQDWTPAEVEIDKGISTGMDAGRQTLDAYIQRTIHNTITMAVDVLRGGRNAWIYEPYVQSVLSGNQQERIDANAAIVRMISDFTNGHFVNLWPENKPIFQESVVAVHSGTYAEKDGSLHDIREVGTLKLHSLHKEQTNARMAEFEKSMAPGGSNGDLGLINIHNRRQVLKQAFAAEINGMIERLFYVPDFFPIFLEACGRAGLRVNSEGLHDTNVAGNLGVDNFMAGQETMMSGIYQTSSAGYANGQGQYVGGNFAPGGYQY